MDCQCSINSTYEESCVICDDKHIRKMNEYNRTQACKQHRIVFICGPCEYVCQSCEKLGWYSTAGTGGGTYHRNKLTGEQKPLNKKITKL